MRPAAPNLTLASDEVAVFLGPTMPSAQAAAFLPARYLPPAQQGDVYALIASSIRTIVLIDGVFHNQPAVWQRELLAAMRSGITVFGSSSMGALRAAELAPLGMIGHGCVFAWYRDGVIDGDDEVAMVHADAANQFRPLSEPMVNIRYTLMQAVREGVITPRQSSALIAIAKDTYYPYRHFSKLVEDARRHPELGGCADLLAGYVRDHRVDIKRQDAVSLLERVKSLGQATGAAYFDAARPALASQQRSDVLLTHRWERVEWRQRRVVLGESAPSFAELTQQLADMAGQATERGEALRQLRTDATLRWFVVEWARQHDVAAPRSDVPNPSTIAGVTHHEIADYRAANALLRWLIASPPPEIAAEIDAAPDQAELPATSIFGSPLARYVCKRIVGTWLRSLRIVPPDSAGDVALHVATDWACRLGPRYFGYPSVDTNDLLRSELLCSGHIATFLPAGSAVNKAIAPQL